MIYHESMGPYHRAASSYLRLGDLELDPHFDGILGRHTRKAVVTVSAMLCIRAFPSSSRERSRSLTGGHASPRHRAGPSRGTDKAVTRGRAYIHDKVVL